MFSEPLALPGDIFNVMSNIGQSLELIMNEAIAMDAQKRINMQTISNKFFRRCGIPANEWGLSDSLFLRYFAKFSKAVKMGKDFSAHATCFLTCLCLMERRDLVQFVVSIYSDNPTSQKLISYESFEIILKNSFETRGSIEKEQNIRRRNDQHIKEMYTKFLAYLDGNPMVFHCSNEETIIKTEPILGFSESNQDSMWEDWQCRINHIRGSKFLSTNLVVQFCSVKHPNTLWPLLMFQSQLRKVFMGEEFWLRWQLSGFYRSLSCHISHEDLFCCTRVLFKLYKTAKLSMPQQTERINGNLNSNSSGSGTCPGQSTGKVNSSLGDGGASGLSPVSAPRTTIVSKSRETTIPQPSQQSQQSHQSQDEAVASTSPSLKTSLRVLIIEDSKAQRKIMMKRLQLASGQLQNNQLDDAWVMGSASSGEEALQIVQTQTPAFDIVVVDENLEGSGGKLMGHEVVKIMRESYNMSNTVIIGCTSNTQRNTTKLLEAGADSVWPKPMPDDSTILQQVAHFLERRHTPMTAVEDITFPTSTTRASGSPSRRAKPTSGSRVQQIISGRY